MNLCPWAIQQPWFRPYTYSIYVFVTLIFPVFLPKFCFCFLMFGLFYHLRSILCHFNSHDCLGLSGTVAEIMVRTVNACFVNLIIYWPCIVINFVIKPTRCTFLNFILITSSTCWLYIQPTAYVRLLFYTSYFITF